MPSDRPRNPTTLYLVSCVSKKQATPALAKDLYVSDWFLKARRYVEATGCPWFILSAKYGLVAPDQMLAPYEHTLNTMSVAERRAWARNVEVQLDEQLPRQVAQGRRIERVVLFAGQRYRDFLLDYFHRRGITVEIPLEGLRIGEQLSWLSQHTADC